MKQPELKLQERVKELGCLIELSRIAWTVDIHDLNTFLSKAIPILPTAMQFPLLAQASITAGSHKFTTPKFKKCKLVIREPLIDDGKPVGKIEIGYLNGNGKTFLKEEKELLKASGQILLLFIRRHAAEKEKQKLQSQLHHAERLAFVGELSAGIAHELNEPLGSILGFAQLIKKAGGLSTQQNDDMERIIKGALYTREIIKKLMIFSRQMPSQLAPVNLNDVVSSTMYFIDVRLQRRKISIHQKLENGLPLVQADPVQMSQVLVNLITNSIHAMPNGGELTISTKKKRGFVSLSVRDTGKGMTAEITSKVFEPFFTTKPVGQGTGLGLSVVHGIIAAHHGKISVTSKPNKGTQFEILLPMKQPKK